MRISTLSSFNRVLLGLHANELAGYRANEQISSGRRILRASDDPIGTTRALDLRHGLSRSSRLRLGLDSGRTRLDQATSALEQSSELMTRTRELVLQAMNGTLNAEDRASIAAELESIRSQLLDQANLQVDGGYVFGGTALGSQPWVEVTSGGSRHVVYRGNGEEQRIQAGEDALVAISAAGDRIFGGALPGAVAFDGLTGIRSGSTADEGTGYANLVLRHDGTSANGFAEVGLALVDGGARDTLLGDNTLTLDATAGTMQLGNGPIVPIPTSGDVSDVVLRNELGGELHLDLRVWSGADYSDTVSGQGSISLDGSTFTAIDFGETDLELSDPALGQVLHVDTTGVKRAGAELATFGDTVNPFDLLQGVVDDLANEQGLSSSELNGRLSARLRGLDDAHDSMLVGLGVLGARSARLSAAASRQDELGLQIETRLSLVEDTDLAEAATDLSRSQLLLQLAQAAGARIMQSSMLNFLR